MFPNILEVSSARSDSYAGTSATVVALTPGKKLRAGAVESS